MLIKISPFSYVDVVFVKKNVLSLKIEQNEYIGFPLNARIWALKMSLMTTVEEMCLLLGLCVSCSVCVFGQGDIFYSDQLVIFDNWYFMCRGCTMVCSMWGPENINQMGVALLWVTKFNNVLDVHILFPETITDFRCVTALGKQVRCWLFTFYSKMDHLTHWSG